MSNIIDSTVCYHYPPPPSPSSCGAGGRTTDISLFFFFFFGRGGGWALTYCVITNCYCPLYQANHCVCKVCGVEPCLALTLLSQPLSAKSGGLAAAPGPSTGKEDPNKKVCSIILVVWSFTILVWCLAQSYGQSVLSSFTLGLTKMISCFLSYKIFKSTQAARLILKVDFDILLLSYPQLYPSFSPFFQNMLLCYIIQQSCSH